MVHAFISYSWKDLEFVEQLETDLRKRGIRAWLDQSNIIGHEGWYKGIVDGVDHAYAMICVVTPHSNLSRWVLREQLYADQLRLPRLVIMPERCSPPYT